MKREIENLKDDHKMISDNVVKKLCTNSQEVVKKIESLNNNVQNLEVKKQEISDLLNKFFDELRTYS